MKYSLGDLTIDTGRQQVSRGTDPVPLPKLSFDLLLALVRAAPNVVSLDQLMRLVWPGLIVSPETVSQRVKLLRDALHDDPRAPRYIGALRGRGYQIIAAVSEITATPAMPEVPPALFGSMEREATAPRTAAPEPGPIIDERPRDGTHRDASPAPARWGATGVVIAVIALIGLTTAYLFANRFWRAKPTNPASGAEAMSVTVTSAAPPMGDKTIAVLPFSDMSERHDQEYLSDGMAEEIIDLLAKVPELKVPARASSFYFKGKSAQIPEIAKALGVSHVLEGSVRKSGNQLRVTVQLVRADNGFQLWSETYDRELRDVFKVQDDIAGAVVTALKASLLTDSAPRSVTTSNTDAYTLYLQARELFQRGTAADYQSAFQHLAQAVALDPRFAAAWSEIARVRVRQYYLGQMPMTAAAPEAHRAVDKALQLDPQLAEAHLTKGRVLYFFDWDWQGADAEMKRALLLDPSIGESYRWAAMTAATLGRTDEAQELLRQALARDPLEAFTYDMLSDFLIQKGQWSEAAKAAERAHDLMPAIFDEGYIAVIALARGNPQGALAALPQVTSPIEAAGLKERALRALGRKVEADSALAELEKMAATAEPAALARIYALRSESDPAFHWLDRAYDMHDSVLSDIKTDPDFNNLKSDPRYAAFLRKMKLPE
jgi:TolB-like protein/DNA-binding winged helix-turn-helix (wHTH) protein/cytochrome c-type biogenesis protein CcmH/NrfG